MNNRDRYKQAFSALRISDEFKTEVFTMSNSNAKKNVKPIAIVAAVVLMLALGTTVAYAADLGGIQYIVQTWIKGDPTDVTLTINNNGNQTEYTMEYTDENGEKHSNGGGGVALDDFGNERPLTKDEILEHLNEPNVRFGEDGTVTIYYYDQTLDITDRFEDGVCHVKLTYGDENLYMIIHDNGHVSYSPHKYPDEYPEYEYSE